MMTRTLRLALVWGGLAAITAACGRGDDTYRPTARPPATRVDAVTETLHGTAVIDD
jgi:hypothetical protein